MGVTGKAVLNIVFLLMESHNFGGKGGSLLLYSKTCLKRPLKNRQNKALNDR